MYNKTIIKILCEVSLLSTETSSKNCFVPQEELDRQKEYSALVASVLSARFEKKPLAFVHTYGCQGNVSDGERIKGLLEQSGYGFTEDIEEADLILYNTCAVREHAEDRIYGNVGAIKRLKKANPNLIIALCGCMMQQQRVAEKIKKSYPFVNLVFGTHVIHKVPELLYKVLCTGKRVFSCDESDGVIAEPLPVRRDGTIKGWLPIMYGCNNFCSYCIVPYVRGRERSRKPESIIAEAKELIALGCKDITLLGQNVNSYGKSLDCDINFSKLLQQINDLEGDFIIRFMTSHPKDCTKELLDTMARCDKVAKHLHLPFQSGNNRVLKQMNRGYTREQYLELAHYARKVMPGLSMTSDVIVGFPGETYEEFKETLTLIDEVQFTSLYTFIFSSRPGTKAASMPDPVSRDEKGVWFRELTDLQEKIAGERTAKMKGETYTVLCEGYAKEGILNGRTQGNIMIEFPEVEGKDVLGKFCKVKVTEPLTWIVRGELAE
ncbi:MAG: tRNA (N6-isopentenyl adenosine(37)-C2)-methylthiotransferase MiaB [Clostridia bacterium]|nr:tRNA (N6-isopentenyl adenosine(37)-C2)-methylthiotransferase MiaB [Clostridia bacterium]